MEMVGGVKSLARRLVLSQSDWDVVFNICEGNGIVGREARAPAILEASGIPFTLSDSATLALCLDKSRQVSELWSSRASDIRRSTFACIPRNSWPSLDFRPLSVIANSLHYHSLHSFPYLSSQLQLARALALISLQ